MTCVQITSKNLRNRAIDNMGISLNDIAADRRWNVPIRFDSIPLDALEIESGPSVADDSPLSVLTPRELEICILHFVEQRSQTLIAEWMKLSLRTVQFHVENAITKIPQLKPLQVQAQQKPIRPKLFHLSQLRPTERGPFNADEV